jgi:hypothetical protein
VFITTGETDMNAARLSATGNGAAIAVIAGWLVQLLAAWLGQHGVAMPDAVIDAVVGIAVGYLVHYVHLPPPASAGAGSPGDQPAAAAGGGR